MARRTTIHIGVVRGFPSPFRMCWFSCLSNWFVPFTVFFLFAKRICMYNVFILAFEISIQRYWKTSSNEEKQNKIYRKVWFQRQMDKQDDFLPLHSWFFLIYDAGNMVGKPVKSMFFGRQYEIVFNFSIIFNM